MSTGYESAPACTGSLRKLAGLYDRDTARPVTKSMQMLSKQDVYPYLAQVCSVSPTDSDSRLITCASLGTDSFLVIRLQYMSRFPKPINGKTCANTHWPHRHQLLCSVHTRNLLIYLYTPWKYAYYPRQTGREMEAPGESGASLKDVDSSFTQQIRGVCYVLGPELRLHLKTIILLPKSASGSSA